ncbi:MAG: PrgI family protein [Patescibacteria group bacterium]
MQQFTVPQFIDVESKIIGPLTTRQFLIILAGSIVGGISYKIFDFSLFLTISIITFLLAITFSFVKINGRPFHLFLLNIIQTIRRPGIRVWNNRLGYIEEPEGNIDVDLTKKEEKAAPKEFYKKSRLAELALVVDTKGRYKAD